MEEQLGLELSYTVSCLGVLIHSFCGIPKGVDCQMY